MNQGNRQGGSHLAVGNHAAVAGNHAAEEGSHQVQAGNLAAEDIPEVGTLAGVDIPAGEDIPAAADTLAGEDIPAAAGTHGHQVGTHDHQQRLASGWT